MPTALIIGSGPGAAGAALALAADPSQQITVIDVGCTLEEDLRTTRRRIASTEEPMWSASDIERISHQPVPTHRGVLPQKRAFGSDFPFRDVGQLEGVQALALPIPRWCLGPTEGSRTSGAPRSCRFPRGHSIGGPSRRRRWSPTIESPSVR